jgi:hypothetical protein
VLGLHSEGGCTMQYIDFLETFTHGVDNKGFDYWLSEHEGITTVLQEVGDAYITTIRRGTMETKTVKMGFEDASRYALEVWNEYHNTLYLTFNIGCTYVTTTDKEEIA